MRQPFAAGQALIDRELFLPKAWTEDRTRCRAAHVPERVAFSVKPRQAEAMVSSIVPDLSKDQVWVAADGVYGRDGAFLAFLEEQALPYVVAVQANQTVLSRPGRRLLGRLVERCAKEEDRIEVPAADPAARSFHGWYRHISLAQLAAAFLAVQAAEDAREDAGGPSAERGDLTPERMVLPLPVSPCEVRRLVVLMALGPLYGSRSATVSPGHCGDACTKPSRTSITAADPAALDTQPAPRHHRQADVRHVGFGPFHVLCPRCAVRLAGRLSSVGAVTPGGRRRGPRVGRRRRTGWPTTAG